MGSKNRERRASKRKARDRRRGFDGGHRAAADDDASSWAFEQARWPPELISDVVVGLTRPGEPDRDHWRAELTDPAPGDVDNVRRGLGLALIRLVHSYWNCGWLPVDLIEHLSRRVGSAELDLARTAVRAQIARYARASLHPRWWDSAVQADVAPVGPPGGAWVQEWAQGRQVRHEQLVETALTLVAALARVSVLPTIVPVPESVEARRVAGDDEAMTGIEPKVLARVRALLAKAESTQFPDEAEALSAKAQDLMNRHALERAIVEGEDTQKHAVITVRMWLDPPYVQAKSLLVQVVADANRCRSIGHTGMDAVSIVGHAGDVEVVQVLTTSLLVQAGRAMAVEGQGTGRGARSRSRSFRQSFLVAYASRIGERLQEATHGAVDDAAADDRLLPVLAARASAVDSTVEETFGDLSARSISVSDHAGVAAGRAAADAASLTLERDRLDQRP